MRDKYSNPHSASEDGAGNPPGAKGLTPPLVPDPNEAWPDPVWLLESDPPAGAEAVEELLSNSWRMEVWCGFVAALDPRARSDNSTPLASDVFTTIVREGIRRPFRRKQVTVEFLRRLLANPAELRRLHQSICLDETSFFNKWIDAMSAPNIESPPVTFATPEAEVTMLGPDLFARDLDGTSLSPIASAFPNYETIVTGRTIHLIQAETLITALREHVGNKEGRDLTREEEDAVHHDAVALLVRGDVVLIRSNPEDMERAFAADALLQRFVPREKIQFTGADLAEVRRALRARGESWRISPRPRSVEEVCDYIRASGVRVATGCAYYYSAETGTRFLTYQTFCAIRTLLRTDPAEARARVREIVALAGAFNAQCVPELAFFLPTGGVLDPSALEELDSRLHAAEAPASPDEAEELFDRFAAAFEEATGAELLVDDPTCAAWRITMFARLSDMNELEVEELTLGLSSEFYLNVKWLPGARIHGADVIYESTVEKRVGQLIGHFRRKRPRLSSINLGRVVVSQKVDKAPTGERRDVYLVVLGLIEGAEEIRLVRMLKWDVMHRLERGMPLPRAVAETLLYEQYVFDRLAAVAALGISLPEFKAIELFEDQPGIGRLPLIYLDREYLSGMATDKIPPSFYGRTGFIERLAGLLGKAAAATLVLGRTSHGRDHVFFDDGDELVQLDDEGCPKSIVMADPTGSFADWNSPLTTLLPHCLWHLARHLRRALDQNVPAGRLRQAVHAFAAGLTDEIRRLQIHRQGNTSRIAELFDDRSQEPGGIRSRFEGVVRRLELSRAEELCELVNRSDHVAPFLHE